MTEVSESMDSLNADRRFERRLSLLNGLAMITNANREYLLCRVVLLQQGRADWRVAGCFKSLQNSGKFRSEGKESIVARRFIVENLLPVR
jgi:hypothetical protein